MMRPSPSRRFGLVVVACVLPFAAGCGSDSDPAKAPSTQSSSTQAPSTPAVASHVVSGKTFLGFPRFDGASGAVQKDPTAWVGASPFPLYVDTEKAVAEMRRDGFVGAVLKLFKNDKGVGSAGSVAVQMRDAPGAKAEVARQVAQAKALPCPGPTCKQKIERFNVPGVPGAIGIDLKTTLPQATTEDGVTFGVTHDYTIAFTKGAFAHQLFAGGPGIEKKRAALIAAAQTLGR